jgi:predicted ATPase
VARVQAADGREIVGRLSGELDRRHRLVRAQAIERLGPRRASRYRFRNYLFQRYLYDSLDTVERAYLHEDVGNVLEEFYGDQVAENAVQLAWHFQEAGIAEKAIPYLHQAGNRAVQLCAYQDGRTHLASALALLKSLPDAGDEDSRSERFQKELDLQLSLSIAWKAGIPDPQGEKVLTRARELCQRAGMTIELCRVLGELSVYPYVRAEYQAAFDVGEQTLSLAQQVGDPLLVALAHWHLGYVSFGRGEFITARAYLQQTISFYEPQQYHHSFVSVRGSDAGVSALAYDACCLWCLGYPEQAAKRSQEALALARELDHAFSLADVLCFGGGLFNSMLRDAQALKESAEEFTRLTGSLDFSSFWGAATCYAGEALSKLGQVHEGLAQIRQGMAVRQSVGARCYSSGILGALAEGQTEAGEPEEGLATLAKALDFVEETGERYYEAELLRLRAAFLLMQGNTAQVEACLQKALEVARRQSARSWELRTTVSLCRLWQNQGRRDDAHQALSEVYGWFTEGFDTSDLREARALLDELG